MGHNPTRVRSRTERGFVAEEKLPPLRVQRVLRFRVMNRQAVIESTEEQSRRSRAWRTLLTLQRGRRTLTSRREQRSARFFKRGLVEMAADELHELVIAHGVGGAFGSDRLFELGSFAQVAHELLLDRAAAGDVNLIRVHQMVTDLLEVLVHQGDFEIVRGILARIGSWTRILGMTDDGERTGGGVVADDGRVVSVHPYAEPPFGFF